MSSWLHGNFLSCLSVVSAVPAMLGCGDLLCEVFHSTESSYYGTNPRLGDLVSFFTEVIWTKINCFTLLIFLGQNSEAPMCFAWLVLCLVTQSCLTLCDPMDCSPPGSSVHGILQARILEWVAMPSSGESSQPRDQTQVSRIAGRCFTLWATREAQGYWSG